MKNSLFLALALSGAAYANVGVVTIEEALTNATGTETASQEPVSDIELKKALAAKKAAAEAVAVESTVAE